MSQGIPVPRLIDLGSMGDWVDDEATLWFCHQDSGLMLQRPNQ